MLALFGFFVCLHFNADIGWFIIGFLCLLADGAIND